MNVFRSQSLRFGRMPEPVTPYQRAGQMWDDYIGSARQQARSWRLAALGGMLLSSVLALGFIHQAGKSMVVPFIVQIDPAGAVLGIDRATGSAKLSDVQIAYHLGRFVENFRSKSTDPVVVKQNWLAAYAFASGNARASLTEQANRHDPFADIGHTAVSVEIASVVRLTDHSFQVRWIERTYTDGTQSATDRYTGILTLADSPPRTEEDLRANPFGFTVDAINWTRDNG